MSISAVKLFPWPLVVWTCAAATGLTLLGGAYLVGAANEPGPQHVSVARSAAGMYADQITAISGWAMTSGYDTDAYRTWATQVRDLANKGATARKTEIVSTNDDLYRAFHTVERIGAQPVTANSLPAVRSSILTAIMTLQTVNSNARQPLPDPDAPRELPTTPPAPTVTAIPIAPVPTPTITVRPTR